MTKGNKAQPFGSLYFLIMLFTLPWLHGGEQTWEFLLFGVAILLSCTVLIISHHKELSQTINSYKLPLNLFVIWLSFCALTIVPLPLEWFSWLDMSRANLSDFTAGEGSYLALSISSYDSQIEILKYIVYLLCLIFIATIFHKQRHVNIVLWVIFGSCSVLAIYSFLNHYTSGQYELIASIPPWGTKWEEVVRGSFSYKNHFAALMNLSIPIGILLTLTSKHKKSQYKNKIVIYLLSYRTITALFVMIILAAMFKSDSRGGLLAIILSFLLVLSISLFKRSRVNILNWKLYTSIVSILLVVGYLFSLSPVYERIQKSGFTPNGRDLMQITVQRIVADYPLFGTGPGTYPLIQHMYKPPELGVTEMSKRAHNDYLELIANQGLIGATLFAIAMLCLLKPIFITKKPINLQLFCLQWAISCMLIHAMFDFIFQLPVLAVYFFVLVGLALNVNKNRKTMKIKNKGKEIPI
ncbi:O-antigen ligase family protein [Aliiglaciecola lipolytica]|uniref:O-antigen ligase family protein n=1 Tax=Aliiglaciecola lipolytica TaxID=477689 RepID=UPI001C092EB3|nr:O-antigen ligase family protein [Aliiglaciecola lipolytica]MBU2880297.1 O-antigen ligase family protein [Aliiglaciecola lipolytica]